MSRLQLPHNAGPQIIQLAIGDHQDEADFGTPVVVTIGTEQGVQAHAYGGLRKEEILAGNIVGNMLEGVPDTVHDLDAAVEGALDLAELILQKAAGRREARKLLAKSNGQTH